MARFFMHYNYINVFVYVYFYKLVNTYSKYVLIIDFVIKFNFNYMEEIL